MAKTLIKVDKNGTKYWREDDCAKCGGKGYISYYGHIDNGVCFDCGGTGKKPYTWKEYTPEYEAKLEAKRIEKAKKEAPEANAKFFKKIGFSANGEAWVVVGIDTFEHKDSLKEAGAKFDYQIGWHFDREQEVFKTVKISVSDIAHESIVGTWIPKFDSEIRAFCDAIRNANMGENPSEYIGAVGEKVEKVVTLKRVNWFETHFGYYGQSVGIYVFEDENKNVVVWKTASAPNMEIGSSVTIRGTVKELNEYKGTKQTILTRCKIK